MNQLIKLMIFICLFGIIFSQTCKGIEAGNPDVCLGRGTCQSQDNCDCDHYDHSGSNCELFESSLSPCILSSEDTHVCSQHGICVMGEDANYDDIEVCGCSDGWYGAQCGTYLSPIFHVLVVLVTVGIGGCCVGTITVLAFVWMFCGCKKRK